MEGRDPDAVGQERHEVRMAVVTQASQAMYIIGRHHDRGSVELLLLLSCLANRPHPEEEMQPPTLESPNVPQMLPRRIAC